MIFVHKDSIWWLLGKKGENMRVLFKSEGAPFQSVAAKLGSMCHLWEEVEVGMDDGPPMTGGVPGRGAAGTFFSPSLKELHRYTYHIFGLQK